MMKQQCIYRRWMTAQTRIMASVMTGVLLTGCLQTAAVMNGSQPDWINAEAQLYPNSHYVTANGSASDAEIAKERALANLTRVFELQIRETTTTRQQVESLKQGGNESVSSSQSLAQQVNIRTSKIIEGARIAEQWRNPDDLTHYALAVLDRRQAGNNIRSEIDRLDNETAVELKQAGTGQNPLQQVASYQRALDLQQERDSLQKTLKVIDLSGRGAAPKWNRAELRASLQESLYGLNMRPAILQDSIGGLGELLRGAMADAGFVETAANAGYLLAAGLDTRPTVYEQGWHWLRGTLTLRLSSADGRVQGSHSWPLKVSATRRAQLAERMKAAVAKKLAQELRPTVLGFATGRQAP